MSASVRDGFVYQSAREHISGTHLQTSPNFHALYHGRGSILLWRRCDMLCTSGFVDDVTFSHNWHYGALLLAL